MQWLTKGIADAAPGLAAAARRAVQLGFFALGFGVGVGCVCAVVALSTGAGLGECVAAVLSVSL